MAPGPDGSGVTPTLSADDLVAAVPQLQDIAEISPRTLILIPGAIVARHDVFSVADQIVAEIDAGAACAIPAPRYLSPEGIAPRLFRRT
jgi:L-asparaginase